MVSIGGCGSHIENRNLSIVGSNPTGGPSFWVLDKRPLLPSSMEMEKKADATDEYESRLHNELTKYNYRLIRLYFYDSIGFMKDSVQPLWDEKAPNS